MLVYINKYVLSPINFAALIGGLSNFGKGPRWTKAPNLVEQAFSQPSKLRHDSPGPFSKESILVLRSEHP